MEKTREMRKKSVDDVQMDEIVQLLGRGEFLTAAQVVKRTGFSRAVVYRRLTELRRRGRRVSLVTRSVREGATGPEATAYAISP